MATAVIVTRDASVVRVRFEASNEIHILSSETRQTLSEELEKIACDETVRVVIFEARGRTFLAGADLAELQGLHQDSAIWYAEAGQKLMNQVARLRPVTICAIQAACAGGGCELALACDVRLAAAGARIGLPETSLGLIPGWGGTVRSTQLFGGAVARRMILSGELLPSAEALRIGLVDQVFADAEFAQGVEGVVAHLLTRGPSALKRAKRLISQLTRSGMKKALAREAREFAECYASLEPLEGVGSFREKRSPSWMATSNASGNASGKTESESTDTEATSAEAPGGTSAAKRKAKKKTE